MSPSRPVGSYPTFSPLPHPSEAVIFFYVNPAVTDTLHINKRDALCCPDFPHTPRGSKRQTVQLLSLCKISARRAKYQIYLNICFSLGHFSFGQRTSFPSRNLISNCVTGLSSYKASEISILRKTPILYVVVNNWCIEKNTLTLRCKANECVILALFYYPKALFALL